MEEFIIKKNEQIDIPSVSNYQGGGRYMEKIKT